jgi:hypothetical protein
VIETQGSDEQQREWLPKCYSHEILGCYLQTEPDRFVNERERGGVLLGVPIVLVDDGEQVPRQAETLDIQAARQQASFDPDTLNHLLSAGSRDQTLRRRVAAEQGGRKTAR